MARERRMEKALSWVGVGAVAGALLLAVVTVALHWAGQGPGVVEEAGTGWFWACVLGGFVLVLGVRWRNAFPGEDQGAERGWDYPFCLAGAAAVTALIAANGVLLGAEAPEIGALSPIELRMAIVVCAIPLGTLLMLTVVRRPLLPPRNRSLPPLGAGVLVVALAGATAPPLLMAEEQGGVRHVVAEDPPERAAIPDQVRRVGWGWELEQNPDPDADPDRKVEVERIVRGAHGPLVVLSDGVVSLDGTDGTELWSYRNLDAGEASVWVGNGNVLFTHVPEPDEDSGERNEDEPEDREEDEPEVRITQVLDLVTGELVAEYSTELEESADSTVRELAGWSDGVRVDSERQGDHSWREVSGVSAWDAESAEELWHRSVAPEPGMVCAGDSPRVRAETVVYAVACVHEEGLGWGDWRVESQIHGEDVDKTFRVVSLDLRTGQEQWSYKLEGEDVFVPLQPWGVPGADGRGSVLVVEGDSSSDPLLQLDPATGEELMFLTKDQVDIDEDLFRETILDVDGSGVTMVYTRAHRENEPWNSYGAEVRHIDTEGKHTLLIGSGGAFVDAFTESAVLSEQVLFNDTGSGESGDRAQVLVASYGERLGVGLHNRIVLESQQPVRQLVAAPGGVAVLVSGGSGDEYGSDVLVEGLVP